ncbi:adenosylcobinamide kinase/adenosylcobinamide phosphate guanyltransferase [Capsulimonas corticalis]|uniref:Adenosylcobinamide kinase n=1 Tax=Capsulimonas corticalis TaxID=2219043 RepID=A0A402D115_9BACT|nr:bifunctional adenosylcobinamide kinase/adenosylcobinamide-phosphate guanylyltransferase [Capsulimonas corticalis]BDI31710.1 adenosylcobinamide kinase/adenosylcobinamide phosphate guanyltransferase [Capsulimonas corticalis]
MSNLTLILGGARSGKSRYAQELAALEAQGRPVVYIATAQAGDEEMRERIARHQQDRPAEWRTVEEPLDVAAVLKRETKAGVILLDCLTFFVVNHMLRSGDAATCEAETWDAEAAEAAVRELAQVAQQAAPTVIVVSNEVGMGLVPETALGRVFRDVAGRANQEMAAAATRVRLLVAGIPMVVKG